MSRHLVGAFWSAVGLGLQTLLILMIAACEHEIDPTVLRFFVYSDLPLTHVRATLLDRDERELLDGGVTRELTRRTEAPPGSPLFSIAVARTAMSTVSEDAVLRLEGYLGPIGSSPVVRQTVHASFLARRTQRVRVLLSRACLRSSTIEPCPEGRSCDYNTGGCLETPRLAGEEYDPASGQESWLPAGYKLCGAEDEEGVSDRYCPPYCGPAQDGDCSLRAAAESCTSGDQCASGDCECVDDSCAQMRCCIPPCSRDCAADFASDPSNCGACGVRCAYPRCVDASCASTARVPPAGAEPVTGSAAFRSVFLRRIVGAGAGVAAVGVHAPEPGQRVHLFVARDEGGEPAEVLARGEVTVVQPLEGSPASLPAAELALPESLLSASGTPFWLGLAVDDVATLAVSQSSVPDMLRVADALPELGQRFANGSVHPFGDQPLAPVVYAVVYP